VSEERGIEEEARPHLLDSHNVLAVFPDMDAARQAIDGLERAGIDAGHISLLGPGAEREAGDTDTTERDVEATGHVGGRALAGGAAGTAAGGAVGFLAGLVAFSIPGVGPVIGAGVWAATAAGAIGGGAVGGVLGGISSVGMTPAWELTHGHVRGGRVVVGVHSEDEEEMGRAEESLRKLDPVAIERFDSRGQRLTGR
jgi:hypothetical protein